MTFILPRERYMQTHKTCIIAEAGVNHNGDVNLALQLIDAAVDAGLSAAGRAIYGDAAGAAG